MVSGSVGGKSVSVGDDVDDGTSFLVELPLGEAAETFDLEKAVCSHGLFMMAPNRWDPLSRSLFRPLRLLDDDADHSSATSVMVRIYNPQDISSSLHVRVYGVRSLSPQHQRSLRGQVVRMLRLSESEERKARDFRRIVQESGEEAECLRDFSGRVFRSPTLFEDMVKCILLCNCQWSRTLSMATALCELQLELYQQRSSSEVAEGQGKKSRFVEDMTLVFSPRTPAGKDIKIKFGTSKASTKLKRKFEETDATAEPDPECRIDCMKMKTENLTPNLLPAEAEGTSCDIDKFKSYQSQNELDKADSCLLSDFLLPQEMEPHGFNQIGNFPSPKELANLDEKFLAKRCNLGYRASRILKLAQDVVEGKVQLLQLEEVSMEASLSNYSNLAEQLSQIDGFGPFTCANVLMCMGFYHVIPADSETVRHLKQVHARNSTIQTVKRDVEAIYEKYAPFQFLAYWAELWHYYEQRFGRLSELPFSGYKRITASNMRVKASYRSKRTKTL